MTAEWGERGDGHFRDTASRDPRRFGMTSGRALLKGLSFFCVLSALFLVLSCSTMPNQYRWANVRVVTNNKVIEGMRFINGWAVEADTQFTAQTIGNRVANDLGKKGSHDIDILVELKSRGTTETTNIWMVSVYNAQAPIESAQASTAKEPVAKEAAVQEPAAQDPVAQAPAAQ
jgi:hypothetical protein